MAITMLWQSAGIDIVEQCMTIVKFFAFAARPTIATGLQNNLNRWCDPTTGSWIGTDPISFTAGDSTCIGMSGTVRQMRLIQANGQDRWINPEQSNRRFVEVDASSTDVQLTLRLGT
ncbi:MAG: hypothetical protein R3C05_01605 [Pirellulaceae bacterium]